MLGGNNHSCVNETKDSVTWREGVCQWMCAGVPGGTTTYQEINQSQLFKNKFISSLCCYVKIITRAL